MSWKDVIKFWFEEVEPKQKWKKDAEFDALIRDRFEKIFWEVVRGEHKEWRSEPEGRLAEIIVLDQFARNMFRDTPDAFKYDDMALELARAAVRVHADKELDDRKREALYMPYMHSESSDAHEEGVVLFGSIKDSGIMKYMENHKKIIDEFGRYPHRNKILGRESTEAEIKHIKEYGGF
jgi:uncharacterized protein (DUF924 family)